MPVTIPPPGTYSNPVNKLDEEFQKFMFTITNGEGAENTSQYRVMRETFLAGCLYTFSELLVLSELPEAEGELKFEQFNSDLQFLVAAMVPENKMRTRYASH